MRPLTIDQLVKRYMRVGSASAPNTNRILEFSAWLSNDPQNVRVKTTKQVRLLFSGDGYDAKTQVALKNFLFSEQYMSYAQTHSVKLQALLKSRESWRAIEVSVCSRTGVLFVPKTTGSDHFEYIFDRVGSKTRSQSQTVRSPPTYIHKPITRTTNRSARKRANAINPELDSALSNIISEAMVEGITTM